jgi:hypothetical protein
MHRPPAPAVVLPLLLGILFPPPLLGQGTAEAPLFASADPVEILLEADFDALADDRDQDEEERDGRAVVTAPDGSSFEVDVEIRTRGNFRLQRSTCRHPPLRLDFPRSRVEGTVLHGEDKLKLVAACRDGHDWEQRVLKEYLVYRLFNRITDRSFRVRLARLTWRQSGEPAPGRTGWGFLIEDEDRLATRLDGEILEVEEGEQLHPARIVGENTGPVVLFQYMVGNSDFSLYGGHNVKLVQLSNRIIPVPYDFDWTGLVNAPYARPDPSLGIRTVRQRVFRGLCRPDVDFEGLYARFREERPAMETLVQRQIGLDPIERDDVLEYLDEFWRVLDDEGARRRQIEEACRGV